jgi:hypothetical protein
MLNLIKQIGIKFFYLGLDNDFLNMAPEPRDKGKLKLDFIKIINFYPAFALSLTKK